MPGCDIAVFHLRSTRPHAPELQAQVDALNARTLESLEQVGARASLVPSAEVPLAESLAAARASDAIVIMGGEDVDPRFYDGPSTYPGSGSHEPEADRAQLAVVRQAVEVGTPVLGVCRGMQLINVALGGNLVPHMTGHRAVPQLGDPFVETTLSTTSPALREVAAGMRVRCTHHQAIDRLGEGLRMVARAADGVIEAVVHESEPVTGVQFHAEHPAVPEQLRSLLLRLIGQVQARHGGERIAS